MVAGSSTGRGWRAKVVGGVLLMLVLGAAGCQPGGASNVLDRACDDTQCVSFTAVSKNIADQLDGKVVGYASYIGAPLGALHEFGLARTAADGPTSTFRSSTKMPVASVSKTVTALAAIRFLAAHNVSLDTAIASYLPSDWVLGNNVGGITFRELLGHRSGIHDYGNTAQDYADVKQFFAKPINPANKTRDYSNYNFSIFRVLPPMVDGFVDDDPASRPAKLAAAYVEIVQQNVFEPVGLQGVACKPPAVQHYAFSYAFPGNQPGWNWGDNTLSCGHAGWYLSVDDIVTVLASLKAGNGKILSSTQFATMESQRLGWDTAVDGGGYRWVEKNGGGGWNGTSLSTSIALFGPRVIGVLFMNSDVSGMPTLGAATVLHDAYKAALTPKPWPLLANGDVTGDGCSYRDGPERGQGRNPTVAIGSI